MWTNPKPIEKKEPSKKDSGGSWTEEWLLKNPKKESTQKKQPKGPGW